MTTAVYTPNVSVPEDVLKAAVTLERWAAENNLTNWRVRSVCGAAFDDYKDAARYRWLVYAGWFDDEIMRSTGIKEGISATVDAAVDYAMRVPS